MNLYREMERKRQEQINEYLRKYAFFAFSKEQFSEGLAKLGLGPDDLGSLVEIPGGGYILADRAPEFVKILNSVKRERETALADPVNGEQFAFDMFCATLEDHEYSYTGDVTESLDALGISQEDLNNNPVLLDALDRATKAVLNERR